jgi:hypothetical protein
MARRFTADAITPFAAQWDEEHHFPRDVIIAGGRAWLWRDLCFRGERRHRARRLEAALIMEAMAYGCPPPALHLDPQHGRWMIDRSAAMAVKVSVPADRWSGDGQDRELLPDRAGFRLRRGGAEDKARRDGDDYVVNGTKQFISGGGANEVYVTMVRTGEDGPKGISCLVIEKDMPGVSFGAQERKLGWHSQPTAQLILEDVRVPVANRVARKAGLPSPWPGSTAGGSTSAPARWAGRSAAWTRRSPIPRTAAVRPGDRRFPEHPVQAGRHGDRAGGSARAALSRRRQGHANAPDKTRFSPPWPSASRPTRHRRSSIARCRLHGGYGYLMDYPIERFWRDLRVHRSSKAPTKIMR